MDAFSDAVIDLQVTKGDVDAALGVMNFAIYHKELTDMDEREAERGREQEAQKKRMAENGDHDGIANVDEEEDVPDDRFIILLPAPFITQAVCLRIESQMHFWWISLGLQLQFMIPSSGYSLIFPHVWIKVT